MDIAVITQDVVEFGKFCTQYQDDNISSVIADNIVVNCVVTTYLFSGISLQF